MVVPSAIGSVNGTPIRVSDIGYAGWYVLETNSPTKDIVADTRANIEYVRKTFRMPAETGS